MNRRTYIRDFVVVALSCFLFFMCHARQDISKSSSNIYIWDAIKDLDLNKTYKETFADYKKTDWIVRPKLGNSMIIRKNKLERNLQIYSACKPHDCGNQQLIFIYDSHLKKGWGKVFINPDSTADSQSQAIEKFILEIIEN